MKAWLLDGYDGIGTLRLGEVERKRPGAGEVLVKVRLAGINPADRYLAERMYPARPGFPHVLGRECLGEVAELGAGVSGVPVGSKVVILRGETGVNRWGTLAEYVAVAADEVIPPPVGWTDEEAAAGMVVYLTAWQALTQWGELPKKAVVLVTGASGGVGTACVQLAAAQGYRVVALTRSDAKAAALKKLGAEIVCNISDGGWAAKLKKILGGGVDLAVDNIGGELLPQVIETLGMNGRVSCVGRLAGPVKEFNTASLFFRRIRLGGVAIGTWSAGETEEAWLEALLVMQRAGRRPVVDRVFGLAEVKEAFARLAEGPKGKVLVRVS